MDTQTYFAVFNILFIKIYKIAMLLLGSRLDMYIVVLIRHQYSQYEFVKVK